MQHPKTDKQDCYHDFDEDPACGICGLRASEQYNALYLENTALKKRTKQQAAVMWLSTVLLVIASFLLFSAEMKQ